MSKYKHKNRVGQPFMVKIIYRGTYGYPDKNEEEEREPKKMVLRYFSTKEELNKWLDKECAKGQIYRIVGYYEKQDNKYMAYYKPPWD